MLIGIMAIIAGIVLLTGLFGVIPAFGKHLDKFGRWLGSFQGVIGLAVLIVAILNFDVGSLIIWMLIISGIMLAAGFLEAIPSMGKHLHKLAKWLGGFQTIIGIVTLILGILAVL